MANRLISITRVKTGVYITKQDLPATSYCHFFLLKKRRKKQIANAITTRQYQPFFMLWSGRLQLRAENSRIFFCLYKTKLPLRTDNGKVNNCLECIKTSILSALFHFSQLGERSNQSNSEIFTSSHCNVQLHKLLLDPCFAKYQKCLYK